MFCGFSPGRRGIHFGEIPARFGHDRGDVPNLAFPSTRLHGAVGPSGREFLTGLICISAAPATLVLVRPIGSGTGRSSPMLCDHGGPSTGRGGRARYRVSARADARARRLRRQLGRHRARRPRCHRARPRRRAHPRPLPAGHGRSRSLPDVARERVPRRHHDRHRPHRRARPGGRARHGRRRLPRQALRPRGAPGPRARAAAAQPAPGHSHRERRGPSRTCAWMWRLDGSTPATRS